MSNESFLFSGSSHLQGIGLVVEKSKKYNSIDWLQKHGLNSPLEYADNKIEHQLEIENRWSYLLCKKFGVNELNVRENPKYGNGGNNDTLYMLLNDKITLNDTITNVFLEPSFTRWTRADGKVFTPSELINYLETPKSKSDMESIGLFLEEIENSTSIQNYTKTLNSVKKKYPKVKFWLIWFNPFCDELLKRPELQILKKDSLNSIIYDGWKQKLYNYSVMDGFLKYYEYKNKLIHQVSNCYKDPQWEVTYYDTHIGSQGQLDLSNLIYEYILKGTRVKRNII